MLQADQVNTCRSFCLQKRSPALTPHPHPLVCGTTQPLVSWNVIRVLGCFYQQGFLKLR